MMEQVKSDFAIVQAGAIAAGWLSGVLNEEERLVRSASLGDDDAWRELVERHQHVVYATTLRLLGSRDDALDVSQETFLAAFRSIKSFKGDSSFSTWLVKIAMRQAYRTARSRPKWQSADAEGAEEPAAPAYDSDLNDTIKGALMTLPLPLRAVVVLREFQGLSYAEIAETLAIAPGTVQSRLHRGRDRLRKLLLPSIKDGSDV